MSVQGQTNFTLIRELISETPEDSTRMDPARGLYSC